MINIILCILIFFLSWYALDVSRKIGLMFLTIVSIFKMNSIIENVYDKSELRNSTQKEKERDIEMFKEYTYFNLTKLISFFIIYYIFIEMLISRSLN